MLTFNAPRNRDVIATAALDPFGIRANKIEHATKVSMVSAHDTMARPLDEAEHLPSMFDKLIHVKACMAACADSSLWECRSWRHGIPWRASQALVDVMSTLAAREDQRRVCPSYKSLLWAHHRVYQSVFRINGGRLLSISI